MRKLAVCVAVLGVAAACSSGPSGPQTYAISMDQASPEGEKLQFSAYYPGSVKVSPGDTIVVTNSSTEAPHTVTLGVKADRSDQPALFVPEENPAAFGPCASDQAPTPELKECASTELPEFDGTGYWNSGLLQPASAPDEAGAKEVEVRLASDIEAGDYAMVCVLHPFMNGTVQVVDEGERESAEAVVDAGASAASDALSAAEDIEEPAGERDESSVSVAAGWGDRVIAVNRFAPAEIEVATGTTVRWSVESPYEPHTVTFESPYEQPADPASFEPGGVASGGDYAGGFANSGLLGPEGGPFNAGPYDLTFTTAGEYTYVCTLHPGQTGTVRVTG